MKKPDYLKWVRWSDDDACFIGSIPDICGDCCHGETEIDVFQQLLDIEKEWIETFRVEGKPLPEPRTRPMMEVA
ncbi:MAG: type II toxin-antitoxin system HicB family antitoxin [Akkermansiaceae bacterium]|jgi:predicted RNase H-like HicB family nuclease|nr:type II toxin-antitoxin system HicB family antitoxin [Akkermansiaceae bacterium]MDP4648050.1 type II toxin-antitoxin system HicB family antitoxin [Akkermansiaceae bacterium]MDP4720297.1 type II toxin-antitoxin system HicB family antitoxin [Akkermansiaceae bacterium]MDP4781398.1 type II toxin-antitoxin system HicB family antitoxin [Akkermansiaceae bacterium]MDP4847831.1 type II toxin-antitoxin system HicB family antitoxin [Akkermansiaceae bacterium]